MKKDGKGTCPEKPTGVVLDFQRRREALRGPQGTLFEDGLDRLDGLYQKLWRVRSGIAAACEALAEAAPHEMLARDIRLIAARTAADFEDQFRLLDIIFHPG